MSIIRQLTGDEGVRKCVYKDHLGYDTIGIGRLVDSRKPGAGLRTSEIQFMLANDVADRVEQLTARLPWFTRLDEARQGVLLNMSFQLGVDGLLTFKNTLRYIEAGNYDRAAINMRISKWYDQTPARAKRMIEQMTTGVWQYTPGT